MKRPGMAELAQAAGVSIATVDRFLNGREAVREDTRIRITEAAQRIGHPAARRLGKDERILHGRLFQRGDPLAGGRLPSLAGRGRPACRTGCPGAKRQNLPRGEDFRSGTYS